jgi:hypothetical protein
MQHLSMRSSCADPREEGDRLRRHRLFLRAPIAWAIVAFALNTTTAMPAFAQTGYTTITLEGLVARSELVVRARVATLSRHDVQDGRSQMTVTLKVLETIRGRDAKMFKFDRETLRSERIFEAWRDAGREHLWFFTRDETAEQRRAGGDESRGARIPLSFWTVVRLAPPVAEEAGFGRPGQGPWSLPIFGRDLSLLSEPLAILKAARDAATEWRGRPAPELHHIDLPGAVMMRSGRSGDVNRLDVPICPDLEALARRMIQSPGDFVAQSDFRPPTNAAERKSVEEWVQTTRDQMRREGVRGLSHFRSAENIALVKTLLDDPAYQALSMTKNGAPVYVQGVPITIGREYYVRKEAYATLRAWGVAVRQPVIEELDRQEIPSP